jgi:hypothetical protein
MGRLAIGLGLLAFAALAMDVRAGDKDKKALPEPPGTGIEHKQLAELAGTFDCKVTLFLGPGKSMESIGIMKREIVLGGRFLQDDFDGSFAGKPFKGHGMTGYDPAKKKYVGVWADSATNALMLSEGTYDAKTKTFLYTGEDTEPYTGKKMKARDTLKLVSADEHVMEMYREPADGKEFKMMEIRFTRKKK